MTFARQLSGDNAQRDSSRLIMTGNQCLCGVTSFIPPLESTETMRSRLLVRALTSKRGECSSKPCEARQDEEDDFPFILSLPAEVGLSSRDLVQGRRDSAEMDTVLCRTLTASSALTPTNTVSPARGSINGALANESDFFLTPTKRPKSIVKRRHLHPKKFVLRRKGPASRTATPPALAPSSFPPPFPTF